MYLWQRKTTPADHPPNTPCHQCHLTAINATSLPSTMPPHCHCQKPIVLLALTNLSFPPPAPTIHQAPSAYQIFACRQPDLQYCHHQSPTVRSPSSLPDSLLGEGYSRRCWFSTAPPRCMSSSCTHMTAYC